MSLATLNPYLARLDEIEDATLADSAEIERRKAAIGRREDERDEILPVVLRAFKDLGWPELHPVVEGPAGTLWHRAGGQMVRLRKVLGRDIIVPPGDAVVAAPLLAAEVDEAAPLSHNGRLILPPPGIRFGEGEPCECETCETERTACPAEVG